MFSDSDFADDPAKATGVCGTVLCKQSKGVLLRWLQTDGLSEEEDHSLFLQKVAERFRWWWSSRNSLHELLTFSLDKCTPFVQLDIRINNRILAMVVQFSYYVFVLTVVQYSVSVVTSLSRLGRYCEIYL